MNQCKYCFEYIKPKKRLYPCYCKTPVHYYCLSKWNQSRTSNITKCEICKYYYNSRLKNILLKKYFIIKIFVYILCVISVYYYLSKIYNTEFN